ncbi:histidine phosphatase family protein [Actinomycetaceae bacterium MB13-C1-2]|nr:histidine phosphatase family protein [Actinomycetaceae bacterium MB13-C1-2]
MATTMVVATGCSSGGNDASGKEASGSTEEAISSQSSDEQAGGPATIYVVRHGKTLFNEKEIVSGWSDSVLTSEGEEQALRAGNALSEVQFCGALTSDLGRSANTAKLILSENDSDVELVMVPQLREQNYGGFDGDFDAEMWPLIAAADGADLDLSQSGTESIWENEALLDWYSNSTEERIVNATAEVDPMGLAENWDEYESRINEGVEVLSNAAQGCQGENILLVAHGGVISALLGVLSPGGSPHNIGNASITTLTYEGGKFTIGDVGVAPEDFVK